MLLEGLVNECDFYQKDYQGPVQGAWVLAQGATGRWCTVMYAGPEYLRDNNLLDSVLTLAQVERQVDLKGGYYLDL